MATSSSGSPNDGRAAELAVVYFFFEAGEMRSDSGVGPLVVRVGTHTLANGSLTTLWNRLAQHRGTAKKTGGNHRGSIFRLFVGAALLEDKVAICTTWGVGQSAPHDVRLVEEGVEARVSEYIGIMPFLHLARLTMSQAQIACEVTSSGNTIALLSNFARPPFDSSSQSWLGMRCPRQRVRASGLWNNNHVDEAPDSALFEVLHDLVAGKICQRAVLRVRLQHWYSDVASRPTFAPVPQE
jgi:hypothetical protein